MKFNTVQIKYSPETHGRGIFEAKLDNFTLVSLSEVDQPYNVELFPNPANSMVSFSSVKPVSKVRIYDNLSRLVNAVDYSGAIQADEFDVSGFALGVYLFEFETQDGEVSVRRLMKR